jgi:hypothetical protein
MAQRSRVTSVMSKRATRGAYPKGLIIQPPSLRSANLRSSWFFIPDPARVGLSPPAGLQNHDRSGFAGMTIRAACRYSNPDGLLVLAVLSNHVLAVPAVPVPVDACPPRRPR